MKLVKRNLLLMLCAAGLLLSGASDAASSDDDDDDPAAGAVMIYLMFAEPEACAQLYPELRKEVDLFRKNIALQMSGGKSSDSALPESAKKEVTACINKKAALSKDECSWLVKALFASSTGNEVSEKLAQEMDSLMQKGRAMLGQCPNKIAQKLRK